MRTRVKINLEIPFILQNGHVTISEIKKLEDVQARVIALIAFASELSEVEAVDTLEEAVYKVFGIEKRMHTFIDAQLNKLFFSNGGNPSNLTLEYGEFKKWQSVILGDVKIHPKIFKHILQNDFVGLASVPKFWNENALIPIVFSETETLTNKTFKKYEHELNKTQKAIFEHKISSTYSNGVFERLIETKKTEVISNILIKNTEVIIVDREFEFLINEHNEISYDSKATDELFDAINEGKYDKAHLVDAIKNTFDVSELLADEEINIQNISIAEFNEMYKKADHNLNNIGIFGKFLLLDNKVKKLVKTNKKLTLNDITIDVYLPAVIEFDLSDIVLANFKVINWEGVLNITNVNLLRIIYKKIIDDKLRNQYAIAFFEKNVFKFGIEKDELDFACTVLTSDVMLNFLKGSKEKFNDKDSWIMLVDNYGLDFIPSIYNIFNWRYGNEEVFNQWIPEQNLFKAIDFWNNVSKKLTGLTKNEIEKIKDDLLSFKWKPIKSEMLDMAIVELEQKIKIASELTLDEARNLALSIRMRLEKYVAKYVPVSDLSVRDKLNLVFKQNAKFDEFMQMYKFTSSFVHFGEKDVLTRVDSDKLKNFMVRSNELNLTPLEKDNKSMKKEN